MQSEIAEERFHITLDSWTDREIKAQIIERIPAPFPKQKV